MKQTRRVVLKSLLGCLAGPGMAGVNTNKTYDVAVIGAGVFGAWTAYKLRDSGKRVVLLDGYGPGNSRASSGGESRVIRMGYGDNELYTRWSMQSLAEWRQLFARIGEPLFHRTGVLWLAHEGEDYSLKTLGTLEKLNVRFDKLTGSEIRKRYPQIDLGRVVWGLLEPDSGVLMARRAVQAVAAETVKAGAEYVSEAVRPPSPKKQFESITTVAGRVVRAEQFVFACGPWMPKLFPELLDGRINPTRQEVFFFGPPEGDQRFAPPAMPVWIDLASHIYGVPDLEGRGFKIAPDQHGVAFDPDTGKRLVSAESVATVRRYLARRFPALRRAPLLETRVCQYENTSNGDFLIDRHPEFSNVWLIGGGSGHGFKHGPAVGDYVASRLTAGGAVDPRLSLRSKVKVRRRSIF